MDQAAAPERTLLDDVQDHEAAHPSRVYLTQPLAGGQVVEYTWGETVDQARRMAAWLRSRGLGDGARVAVLSKNCAHFFMLDLAIWFAGGCTVAIYPTETAATVRYVLEHSGSQLLFVGKLDAWESQREAVPEGLTCVALPLAPASARDGSMLRWEDLVAANAPLAGRLARSPGDMAILVYTSGSTGEPKGVMHSFAGMTASARAIADTALATHAPGAQIRMLSYLPLAHVMERAYVEAASMVSPADVRIFFAESLDTFLRDLARARPTIFLSVPRLWVKFQEGVFANLPPARLARLLRVPLLRRVVARKVLAQLGLDSVLLAGSGSAPISRELIDWYRSLGLNLCEGYGMTEDFSLSHIADPRDHVPGTVGRPMAGVRSRISETGEVELRSAGCMLGYYRRPDLTAEAFTPDGWFRTGDLGEFDAQGRLKLTGRAKELFKTAKGKYVAPAPLENLLNVHPMIESSLVGGVGRPAAHAVVVLAEHLRPHQAEPALRAEVEAEMRGLLARVNAQVAEHERLQLIAVADQAWSIENGCLTPTMKIKRARIEAVYEQRVGDWYAAARPVVWA